MKRILAAFLTIAMVLICIPVFAYEVSPKAIDVPERDIIGKSLAAVHAPYLAAGGGSSTSSYLTSADFSEYKLTILMIWDNNCSWCQAEMPFMQRLHDEIDEILVVGVCSHFLGGSYQGEWNYLQQHGYTFTNVKPDAVLNELMEEVSGVPYNVIVDSEGTVIGIIDGAMISWRSISEEIGPYLAPLTEMTCTATFVENVTGSVIAEEEIPLGTRPSFPSTPQITGYNFNTWNPSSTYPLLSDTTFTATYLPKTLFVKFYDSLDNNTLIQSVSVSYGNPVEPPVPPTHFGYAFVGWDQDLSCITNHLSVYTIYVQAGSGDVDMDGEVSAADALIALRASMNMLTLSSAEQFEADVDGDGTISAADALLILRASMDML